MRIPISFGAWKPVLMITGMLPRWCRVDIDDDALDVRMSWAFQATVPRSSVRSARRRDGWQPLGFGVHGWRDRWLVNGSWNGLVSIEIDPPARARVLGVPVRLRELHVSVDDPDALVAGLS